MCAFFSWNGLSGQRVRAAFAAVPIRVRQRVVFQLSPSKRVQSRSLQRRDELAPLVDGCPLNAERARYGWLGTEMRNDIGGAHDPRAYPMGAGPVNDGIREHAASSSTMADDETKQQRIKRLREARGLSQAELGRRLGVTRAAVQKWENGDTENIENATFVLLCRELGTDPAYLIWGPDRAPDGEPPVTPPEDTGSTGRFRIVRKRG